MLSVILYTWGDLWRHSERGVLEKIKRVGVDLKWLKTLPERQNLFLNQLDHNCILNQRILELTLNIIGLPLFLWGLRALLWDGVHRLHQTASKLLPPMTPEKEGKKNLKRTWNVISNNNQQLDCQQKIKVLRWVYLKNRVTWGFDLFAYLPGMTYTKILHGLQCILSR